MASMGIAHNDLADSNVLLESGTGKFYLVDFGKVVFISLFESLSPRSAVTLQTLE